MLVATYYICTLLASVIDLGVVLIPIRLLPGHYLDIVYVGAGLVPALRGITDIKAGCYRAPTRDVPTVRIGHDPPDQVQPCSSALSLMCSD